MNVLVLGGTLFLGRHVVEAALQDGHEVTLFNRGSTHPDLFPGVEKLRGDRDGNLDALRGRSWDAVIDTSGYVPRIVRASAELLRGATRCYVFVSSCSVYADTSQPGVDESAPLLELDDDADENVSLNYGALKAGCERVVEEVFAARNVIVRAGLIVGPHDPTNRFTYWVTRMARGGTVLAPEPKDQPVQFIDARDLAQWMLHMCETSASGTYNVTGPDPSMTMEETLEGIQRSISRDAEMVWVGENFLVEEAVEPWSELPLWLAPNVYPEHRGFLSLDISSARGAGLTFRPLSATVHDTLEWAGTGGNGALGDAGLDPRKEAELLGRWQRLGAVEA